jgi:WYL domain
VKRIPLSSYARPPREPLAWQGIQSKRSHRDADGRCQRLTVRSISVQPLAFVSFHVWAAVGSTAHVDADRVVLFIDHQLRTAIAGRRLIRFTYMKVSRVAEPHDYGIQNGALRLLVYQLRAKPFSRGWRMLDVAKIQSLVVLDQTFAGSRGAAYRTHLKWDRVFARVE